MRSWGDEALISFLGVEILARMSLICNENSVLWPNLRTQNLDNDRRAVVARNAAVITAIYRVIAETYWTRQLGHERLGAWGMESGSVQPQIVHA